MMFFQLLSFYSSQIVYSVEGMDEFIYIVDTHNFRIRKLSITNKTIITYWWTRRNFGNGINITDTLLTQPTGLAFFRILNMLQLTPFQIHCLQVLHQDCQWSCNNCNSCSYFNATIAPTSIAVGEDGEVTHTLKMLTSATCTISVMANTG